MAELADKVRKSLRRRLSTQTGSGERVIDIFRAWDQDVSGSIDKEEFCKAVLQDGAGDLTADEVDAFFESADVDGSGTIEFSELNKAIRRDDVVLDAGLQAGAQGAIAVKSENTASLRSLAALRRASKLSGSFRLSNAPGKSIIMQLAEIVREARLRAIDLFLDWDADKSGTLDSAEFASSIRAMGCQGDGAAIRAAFDAIDKDRDGIINVRELEQALKAARVADAKPTAARKTFEFKASSSSPRSQLLERLLRHNKVTVKHRKVPSRLQGSGAPPTPSKDEQVAKHAVVASVNKEAAVAAKDAKAKETQCDTVEATKDARAADGGAGGVANANPLEA